MDTIFLRDLEVETIIGIYDWERTQKQTVSIDLTMPGDIRRAAQSDSIEATLNYKKVAKRVIAFVEGSSYQLVETLAENIAGIGLNEFGMDWIEVRVAKPGAVRGAKDVGVQIRRGLCAGAAARECYVSMGSNVDAEANIAAALEALGARFGAISRSSVYRNPAVGFDGDDFLNLVVGFESDEPLGDVLDALHEIENRFGRARGADRFTPRTMDLDLLLYGDAAIARDGLTLPRPELTRYAFMLKPLAELAGHRRDPISGVPYAKVWERAGLDDHAMTPVPWPPPRRPKD